MIPTPAVLAAVDQRVVRLVDSFEKRYDGCGATVDFRVDVSSNNISAQFESKIKWDARCEAEGRHDIVPVWPRREQQRRRHTAAMAYSGVSP